MSDKWNPYEEYGEELDELRQALANVLQLRWAVVVSTGPLRIRWETETEPLAGRAPTLVAEASLAPGDRVAVLYQNHRVVVIGRGGGIA